MMFYSLSKDYIETHINDILCQYSNNCSDVLFDDSFEPESFTALEKLNGEQTLFFSDLLFDEWVGNMLREQFISGGVEDRLINDAVECGIKSFKTLLDVCGERYKIYNQEVVDILRRISAFTITGKLGDNIDTAIVFNEFAHRIMPEVIEKIKSKGFSLQELLKLSIISGLSGLDLKGATAAASSHKNDGIPMKDLVRKTSSEASNLYIERLLTEYKERTFPIYHFDELLQRINRKTKFNLVWMTDDIIESYFDLTVIEILLSLYDVEITLVPKNGRFGNDASFNDICKMMSSSLSSYLDSGRFRLCEKGPLMAAANLRKLSPEHSSLIIKSDAVILKGCRISEMFNGGVNAHTYVAYSIVRKVSEKITGYNAESKSSVFFHLCPGEYAFWGVGGSDEIFKLGSAYSTLKDHFNEVASVEDIVGRFNAILRSYRRNKRPIYQELDSITNLIAKMTAYNYDKVALCYESLERRDYSEYEQVKWKRLIDTAHKIFGSLEPVTILDVGVGDGKGVRFAHSIGMDVWGCDVSDAFIKMAQNQLPDELESRIVKCDMRSLPFDKESFHIIRHNATLVHMPLIGPGYGSDKAISEASRVLKHGGLLYISLKIGDSDGICFIDTNEGLGKRIYQLYKKSDIENLLIDNGFIIIDKDSLFEQRTPTQMIEWYNIIARKN